MKIYDCFLFFNEIELLEVRLELLYEHVDFFILSECDHTFSGLPKPFYFEENKEKFSKFLDKIIHVKVNNSNQISNFVNTFEGKQKEEFESITQFFESLKVDWKNEINWCLDFLHREYVRLGMYNCEDEDLIIFSDLDEIPNPKIFSDKFEELKNEEFNVLIGNNFSYYINVLSQTVWYGPLITKYKNIKGKSVGMIRIERLNFNKIPDGCWHFTNMGGEERIITKIKSWGHQEYNYPYMLSSVKNKLQDLTDLFDRVNNQYRYSDGEFYYEKMKLLDPQTVFPTTLLKIIEDKFPHFIKK